MENKTNVFMDEFNELIGNGRNGNDCHRFGIVDGCKPHCPVFMRGECEIQDENEEYFKNEFQTNDNLTKPKQL